MIRNLFSGLFARQPRPLATKQVIVITNFSSCKLGLALLEELAAHPTTIEVIAMAHNAGSVLEKHPINNVVPLDGFPNE